MLGKIQTLVSLITTMKMMCLCNIMWNLPAKGEMPQLLSGIRASIVTLFSRNANPEFQHHLLDGRFVMDGLSRRSLNSWMGSKYHVCWFSISLKQLVG